MVERANGALDGVIAKRLDKPDAAGKRDMLKVKTRRTADFSARNCTVWCRRQAARSASPPSRPAAGAVERVAWHERADHRHQYRL